MPVTLAVRRRAGGGADSTQPHAAAVTAAAAAGGAPKWVHSSATTAPKGEVPEKVHPPSALASNRSRNAGEGISDAFDAPNKEVVALPG